MTRAPCSRTPALLGVLLLGLTLAGATTAAPATSKPQFAPGRLDFQLTLEQSGPFFLPYPVGVPPGATASIPWTGSRSVRGLGNVSVSYTWLLGVGWPACSGDLAKPLPTAAQVDVAGKGTIDLMFAEGARCLSLEDGWATWQHDQKFTITGGKGLFASASGTGTRQRSMVAGTETWTGTLEVPDFEFDVTAPKLHGAGSKTVRAKNGATSVRVTFKVTATDRTDGAVSVSCRPRSGSRFKIGRTTVRCEATDSSGNAGTAAFTVAVR